MTLSEGVRAYINTCPCFKELSKESNLNFLSGETGSYSIEEVQVEPIIKRYIDGTSIKQYVFELSSREIYSDAVANNLKISKFYEEFSKWLEEQCKINNLPNIGEGKEARDIETILSSAVVDKEADKAQYKVRCKLTYVESK